METCQDNTVLAHTCPNKEPRVNNPDTCHLLQEILLEAPTRLSGIENQVQAATDCLFHALCLETLQQLTTTE